MPITCYLTFDRIGRFAYTKIEKVAYELPKTLYNCELGSGPMAKPPREVASWRGFHPCVSPAWRLINAVKRGLFLKKTLYDFSRFLLSTVQHETCVFLYGSCLHGHLIDKKSWPSLKLQHLDELAALFQTSEGGGDTLLLSTVGTGESLPANEEERGGINHCLQKNGAGPAAQAADSQKGGGHGGRVPDVDHGRPMQISSGGSRQRL
jgi:hypothetical protein